MAFYFSFHFYCGHGLPSLDSVCVPGGSPVFFHAGFRSETAGKVDPACDPAIRYVIFVDGGPIRSSISTLADVEFLFVISLLPRFISYGSDGLFWVTLPIGYAPYQRPGWLAGHRLGTVVTDGFVYDELGPSS